MVRVALPSALDAPFSVALRAAALSASLVGAQHSVSDPGTVAVTAAPRLVLFGDPAVGGCVRVRYFNHAVRSRGESGRRAPRRAGVPEGRRTVSVCDPPGAAANGIQRRFSQPLL